MESGGIPVEELKQGRVSALNESFSMLVAV